MTTQPLVQTSNPPLPPLVAGLPVFGHSFKMMSDPLRHFINLHRQYGSAFRIKTFNRTYTVLAGMEANQLVAREDGKLFHSAELFSLFAEELNSDAISVVLDGERHIHFRKITRHGYSREAIVPQLARVVAITQDYVKDIQKGDSLSVLPFMQRLVVDQLGILLTNTQLGDYFPDLQLFLNTLMNVGVVKLWPRIMLYRPAYHRSKARIIEFVRQVVQTHREFPDDYQDLVDDVLTMHDLDGQELSDEDKVALAVGPYIAGMDTVAITSSFMLYSVLKYPEVLARVKAEVADFFAKNDFSLNALKDMKALHGLALETLRMYPVAPFIPRQALCDFEFDGYRVKKGDQLLFATSIMHYMPEYFADPETFNIDRYAEGGRPPFAFAPYGLGPHTCLGAGLAEVQLMINLATLLHTMDMELDPLDYDLRIVAVPLPRPDRHFKVRVVKK